ncbi:hypothetical protein [Escherichia coli]
MIIKKLKMSARKRN